MIFLQFGDGLYHIYHAFMVMLGIVYYWVYHITMHRNATFWKSLVWFSCARGVIGGVWVWSLATQRFRQYVAVQHSWFTKPNSFVYLDLLKMFFFVSHGEIQYLGNLWQILIFSGVPQANPSTKSLQCSWEKQWHVLAHHTSMSHSLHLCSNFFTFDAGRLLARS